MSEARPIVLSLDDNFDVGRLTVLLKAEAERQGYAIKGDIQPDHDAFFFFRKPTPPAPPTRAAEDLQ